jgi:hypothetical protein
VLVDAAHHDWKCAGGVAAACMRRASAAARHLVWLAALAAAFALPPVALVLRAAHVVVRVPVATPLRSPDAVPSPPSGAAVAASGASISRSAEPASARAAAETGRRTPMGMPWQVVALLVWAVGPQSWRCGSRPALAEQHLREVERPAPRPPG